MNHPHFHEIFRLLTVASGYTISKIKFDHTCRYMASYNKWTSYFTSRNSTPYLVCYALPFLQYDPFPNLIISVHSCWAVYNHWTGLDWWTGCFFYILSLIHNIYIHNQNLSLNDSGMNYIWYISNK